MAAEKSVCGDTMTAACESTNNVKPLQVDLEEDETSGCQGQQVPPEVQASLCELEAEHNHLQSTLESERKKLAGLRKKCNRLMKEHRKLALQHQRLLRKLKKRKLRLAKVQYLCEQLTVLGQLPMSGVVKLMIRDTVTELLFWIYKLGFISEVQDLLQQHEAASSEPPAKRHCA